MRCWGCERPFCPILGYDDSVPYDAGRTVTTAIRQRGDDVLLRNLSDGDFVFSVGTGQDNTYVLLNSGVVQCWGDALSGVLGRSQMCSDGPC